MKNTPINIQNILSKNDLYKTRLIVAKLLPADPNGSSPNELQMNSKITNYPKPKVELFNQFFCIIGQNLPMKLAVLCR